MGTLVAILNEIGFMLPPLEQLIKDILNFWHDENTKNKVDANRVHADATGAANAAVALVEDTKNQIALVTKIVQQNNPKVSTEQATSVAAMAVAKTKDNNAKKA